MVPKDFKGVNMKKKNVTRELMEAALCYSVLAMLFLIVSGCTLSFQNISTHGTATDLVDENQKADGKVNLEIPLNKMGV